MSTHFLYIHFVFLLLWTATCQNAVIGQNSDSWVSLADEIDDPIQIRCLKIDFSVAENHWDHIRNFSGLENIWLQEIKNEDATKIKNLKCPISLIISDSPDFDISTILEENPAWKGIARLALIGNQLDSLPLEVASLEKLEKIQVNDNPTIELKHLFNECAKFRQLTSIDLSGNDISALPTDLPSMKNIKVLDLKGNFLESAGTVFSVFPELDSIMLQGNIFSDLPGEMNGLNRKIRYVSIDSSVTLDDKWQEIGSMFPKTSFVLFPDIPASGLTLLNNQELPDSLLFTLKNKEDTLSEDTLSVGYLKLEKSAFRILSDAYLHYPRLFPNVNPSFDSLLFEERFADVSYINNVKRRPWQKGYLQLEISNRFFRPVVFMINIDRIYLFKNYTELNIYNKTAKWLCKDKSIKRAKFKKLFTGTKKKPVFWNDMKIEYDTESNDYVFILKNDSELVYLNCILKDRNFSLFRSRKQEKQVNILTTEKANLKKYLRYVKARNSRENKWNKAIIKDKEKYIKAMNAMNMANWLSFQKMYMSEEELQMTMKEWLQYYESVIANEPEAVKNMDASVRATIRALEIDGYTETSSVAMVSDTLPIVSAAVQFKSKQDQILAISKILVILPTSRSFYTIAGTMNSDYVQLLFPDNEKIMVVAETVSGKVCASTVSDVEKAMKNVASQYEISMQVLDSKIATVGQIYNILSW